MKKLTLIALATVALFVLLYVFCPYKIKTVCFGDICPQNGGTYLLYKTAYSEEECKSIGGNPIVGIGWVRVYAGCAPNNALARFMAKKLND